MIDRDLNEIYLYSAGDAYKTITSARATSITDNTYIYATASYGRDYYKCSYETMRQVLTLLEGRRIAEPMRYICSALLAIILALLINYFIVMFYSRSRKESDKAILGGIQTLQSTKLQQWWRWKLRRRWRRRRTFFRRWRWSFDLTELLSLNLIYVRIQNASGNRFS